MTDLELLERLRVKLEQPSAGTVSAVYNSPGSPYIAPALRYDVKVQTTGGERIIPNVRPSNKYPAEYDVYGAVVGTPVTIAWVGSTAYFNIPWSEAVTDECVPEPPP